MIYVIFLKKLEFIPWESMKRFLACAALLASAAAQPVIQPAGAQPAAVLAGQQGRWPEVKSVDFSREGCCWEAEFEHEGQSMEALWMRDGTLYAIMRPIPRNQVPEPVQLAMGRRWNRVRETELMLRTSGRPLYELDLGGNRKRWFTAEGKPQRKPCTLPRRRLPTSGWDGVGSPMN